MAVADGTTVPWTVTLWWSVLLDGHSWQVDFVIVASLVAIADSTITELQNTLIGLSMPVCIVLCSVFFFVCVCLY